MATLAEKIAAQNTQRKKSQQEGMGLLGALRNAGHVINEGLLNPNQYNAPAANRFKDSALGLLGGVPGVGDVASGAQAADYWNRGEKMNAGLAALGALPMIPSMAGIFIGKGAKTWDAIKASEAEKLLASGADPREVWKQTGTFQGVDKNLRQEIPDNLATLDSMGDWRGRADMAYKHGPLYAAYPDMAGTPMRLDPEMAGGNLSNNMITSGTKRGNAAAKSTTAHEFQHAIQQREGWAQGGSPEGMRQVLGDGQFTGLYSPEELNDAYRRLAGEAEARLVQSRMNMPAAERLQSYPPDMFDVPPDRQIVRGPLGENAGVAMNKPLDGLLAASENIGMGKPLDYQISHKPMTVDGGASRLDDLTGAFGEDIYGKNALQYFGSGDPREKATLRLLHSIRGNPDKMVTIYRGVPEGVDKINAGDWVTLDKNVAADYGSVISQQVPARYITSWPDSLLEFGYYPD